MRAREIAGHRHEEPVNRMAEGKIQDTAPLLEAMSLLAATPETAHHLQDPMIPTVVASRQPAGKSPAGTGALPLREVPVQETSALAKIAGSLSVLTSGLITEASRATHNTRYHLLWLLAEVQVERPLDNQATRRSHRALEHSLGRLEWTGSVWSELGLSLTSKERLVGRECGQIAHSPFYRRLLAHDQVISEQRVSESSKAGPVVLLTALGEDKATRDERTRHPRVFSAAPSTCWPRGTRESR